MLCEGIPVQTSLWHDMLDQLFPPMHSQAIVGNSVHSSSDLHINPMHFLQTQSHLSIEKAVPTNRKPEPSATGAACLNKNSACWKHNYFNWLYTYIYINSYRSGKKKKKTSSKECIILRVGAQQTDKFWFSSEV